ncbi:MAG: hypothetical protein NDF55_02320 [archaeon GB-1867-005]|nr:hypothetical protein [Candidatus Culexmicrobium cathedralense]
MIVEGRIVDFVALILIWAIALIAIDKIRKGWTVSFRRIAGLDALEEAVGRAAEMGRPVHFTSGLNSLTGTWAPLTVAGLAVFGEVARLCAKYRVPVIYSVYGTEVIPIAHELYKQAYLAEGRPEEAKPEEAIRYLSSDQFAYAAAVQGIAERERPAANIMVGPFYAESLIFAETFFRVGAIQIAGTARLYQIPFFAIVCDYVLIGEECYAAGAYLTKDPSHTGSLFVQDLGKLVAIVLGVIGALLTSAGSKAIVDLLSL